MNSIIQNYSDAYIWSQDVLNLKKKLVSILYVSINQILHLIFLNAIFCCCFTACKLIRWGKGVSGIFYYWFGFLNPRTLPYGFAAGGVVP